MINSSWVFGCVFGFRQDTCGKYERDERSRGAYAGFVGCPSCVNRVAGNDETEGAELAWEGRDLLEVLKNRHAGG